MSLPRPPDPEEDDLDFSSAPQKVDLYVLVDLSQSMEAEADDVRANLSAVLRELSCPPAGNGDPDRLRMQDDPGAVGSAIRRRPPGVRRRRRQHLFRHRERDQDARQQRAARRLRPFGFERRRFRRPLPQCATGHTGLLEARVDVHGDEVTLLDSRDVWFVIPPVLDGPGVE